MQIAIGRDKTDRLSPIACAVIILGLSVALWGGLFFLLAGLP